MSGPIDSVEPRSTTTRGRSAAVVAIVLATIATVWLVVWPCFYTGATSGPGGESTTCSSLIAENGTWVLSYLAIPIILTVLAFFALVARLRAVMWTLAISAVRVVHPGCLVHRAVLRPLSGDDPHRGSPNEPVAREHGSTSRIGRRICDRSLKRGPRPPSRSVDRAPCA